MSFFTRHTFESEDVTINYVDSEHGYTPVLFLHSSTVWWRIWYQEMILLSPLWRVLAYDYRGHGQSGRSKTGSYEFLDFARDLESFVEQVIQEPTVLIGHSWGAMQALWLAANRPELVKAAVLSEPLLHTPSEDEEAELRSLFADVAQLAESDITTAEIAEHLLESTPDLDRLAARHWAAQIRHLDPIPLKIWSTEGGMEGYDPESLSPDVQCPVLLAVADPELSMWTNIQAAERTAESMGDCTLRVYTGAGHVVHNDLPAEFQNDLLRFMHMIDTG